MGAFSDAGGGGERRGGGGGRQFGDLGAECSLDRGVIRRRVASRWDGRGATGTDRTRRLAGRRVLHWIDNSSAVAALVKGYSAQPDSARIVHAVHATLAGLATRAWFEYVRTDANVADEPSCADLSGVRCALGAAMVDRLGGRLFGRPVAAVLPVASRWDEAGAAWMWRARDD